MRLSELWRRVCWVALTASLPALTFGLWPEPPLRSASPASPPVAFGETASREAARHFERFALNALLVPLLDAAEHPPRWADPSQGMVCGAGSQVKVDGGPLESGLELSGRGFSVQWQLNGCLPFGIDGLELTGRAELDVFLDDEGLSAIVRADQLRVQHAGQVSLMNSVFVARTP